MQTEPMENNSQLAESLHVPQSVLSVPYAIPVTPPPVPQSQQPINYSVRPPPALIPYQSNALPNGLISPSGCANCSGPRQAGNPPPVNAPKPPFAIPHPAAGNANAPQIGNGPGAYPMQSRMVNNLAPLPPMPQRQNIEQTWNNLPHETFNQVPMAASIQRPGPAAMGPLMPMMPNIMGYEVLDLHQRPMNQGPQARYPAPNGSIPFVNGPPPPMPEIQRPNAANGPLPSQSIIPLPVNPPFQQGITPLPPPHLAYANFGPPPPKLTGDLDLANQFRYLSIGFENDNSSFSPKVTPKYLQAMYNDLDRLARQISPTTTLFDSTGTIRSQLVGKFNLPHPSEWSLSIRCYSCKRPFPLRWLILLVLNGNITTNETLLTLEESPLCEYNNYFHMNKYPLFVLNYIGGRGNEIPKHEFTFGLNNVEQDIQAMKARIIKEKFGVV